MTPKMAPAIIIHTARTINAKIITPPLSLGYVISSHHYCRGFNIALNDAESKARLYSGCSRPRSFQSMEVIVIHFFEVSRMVVGSTSTAS